MDRKVSRQFEIALCAAIAAIAAIVTWQVAAQEHRPLDVEELQIDVADIQSLASEGGFLVTHPIGASVTRSFANAHAGMWRDKIDELARKYGSREPEASSVQSFDEVRALADRLHAVADEISRDSAQNGAESAAAAHLHETESRARTLKSRLEHQAD
jgi:hypothetical protein